MRWFQNGPVRLSPWTRRWSRKVSGIPSACDSSHRQTLASSTASSFLSTPYRQWTATNRLQMARARSAETPTSACPSCTRPGRYGATSGGMRSHSPLSAQARHASYSRSPRNPVGLPVASDGYPTLRCDPDELPKGVAAKQVWSPTGFRTVAQKVLLHFTQRLAKAVPEQEGVERLLRLLAEESLLVP